MRTRPFSDTIEPRRNRGALRFPAIDQVPVLGTHADLLRLARELRPDEIILAITNSQSIRDELFQAILECSEIGIRITTMPALYETITGRVPIDHAGQNVFR